MDAIDSILDKICNKPISTKDELKKIKRNECATYGISLVRNDSLLRRYRKEIQEGKRKKNKRIEDLLRLNQVRSSSGIATVTVITKPYPCPGRCLYCPNESNSPKSYLSNEPAIMRALRSSYDPYKQVSERLKALHETGHPIDKIDLLIKGGSWSHYPKDYKEKFIKRCFDAANDFLNYARGNRRVSSGNLSKAQAKNEKSRCRIIGITIETRPDLVSNEEIRFLRRLGITRVELGVQSLDERILRLNDRGHGIKEIAKATRCLRDAGFKIAYHMMPNLPGSNPKNDLKNFQKLFLQDDYRPDAIKIYPCVVIKSARLFKVWKSGKYRPYAQEKLTELLINIKKMIPEYVRIERIIRDIPSGSISAGCRYTNLREEVQKRMKKRGLHCRCIRCRQIDTKNGKDLKLIRREFNASEGKEVFLSFEDATKNRIASLLRLRLPSRHSVIFPALKGCALIRELHTYGIHTAIGKREDASVQHTGLGKRLLKEAERIASDEWRLKKIAVISGVGTREYYRGLGYRLYNTYMTKELR